MENIMGTSAHDGRAGNGGINNSDATSAVHYQTRVFSDPDPMPDPVAIETALRLIVDPGTVFEVRALRVKMKYGRPAICSGFYDFDHISDAARDVAGLGGIPGGVYVTINPCKPEVLARRANRMDRADNGETTSDHEILKRTTLLIDCDADRPAGISATDAEHTMALELAARIKSDLYDAGWPEPVHVDSGNGGQLWFGVNLPVDDGGIIQRTLAELGKRYDSGQVHIDQTVHNPSRIGRLPGTINRKGDNVPSRPHRMARLLHAPERLEPVPRELLETLAGPANASRPSGSGAAVGHVGTRRSREDVERFIAAHLSECEPGEPQDYKDGTKWVLKICPFDSSHTGGSAALFLNKDGVPGFRCQHNSCRKKNWNSLLDRFGEGPRRNQLPVVLLPGGRQSIVETAETFGRLFGEANRVYSRGGALVAVEKDETRQIILRQVTPAMLASEFERVANLVKTGRDNEPAATVCSEQTAKLIGACSAFIEQLPPLKLVTRCPVLIDRAGKLLQIAGYDRESGIWAGGSQVPDIPLPEAVKLLHSLVADFRFPTESDRARALAALITPSLVLGGLLGSRAPIDLGEADDSQAGKGYRLNIKSCVYGESLRTITQKKNGGVGSLEEAFNAALIAGATFINIDNVRGNIDSPAIESFMTGDRYMARSAYSKNMEIDPRRVILCMTSNKADMTTDLANRSACVRIVKQPPGYAFATFPEGDVLDHVEANQARFLGAVFAIVRAWHAAGRPKTKETRHDFRKWAQTLDWMTQNLLEAGPLLDGHKETQQRMTNPALNWLRDVAIAVVHAKQDVRWLRTNELVDTLAEHSCHIPGLPEDGDISDEAQRKSALQATGRKLGTCFRSGNEVVLDDITIQRREAYNENTRSNYKEYFFVAAKRGGASTPIAADSPASAAKSNANGPNCEISAAPGTACFYGAEICGYAAADPAAEETPVAANAADSPLFDIAAFLNSQRIARIGSDQPHSRNSCVLPPDFGWRLRAMKKEGGHD
jgi:hypothetical protein